MSKLDVLKAAGKIDGWLTVPEASALYELAHDAQGPIVEIGSWHGRSTAVLALASMEGNYQPVYAIDPFSPVLQTITGEVTQASSPELLRANLDGAGVNGLVHIVAKNSKDAIAEVPDQIGVLFVDGAHDYESVKRDLAYLSKVQIGGYVAIHDCHEAEPGVVKAVDEVMSADPSKWRCRWRADTIVIFERRNTIRRTVLLGFPGGNMHYGAHKGLVTATLGAHDVYEEQSGMGWDDMNRLWCWALNQAAIGKITHFAMLHSDILPSPGWIDLLIDELEAHDADFISAIAALKDENGLTSCGIGDVNDPWNPYRRFTMTELIEMPETFDVSATPHPDKYILHNSGCWVADLRNPLWRTVDKNRCLVADFAFPIRGRMLDSGEIVHERESEDWHFSRMIASLGLKTLATRRVSTVHFGQKGFRNDHKWGVMEHDEATRSRWGNG
jgi:hypothetical protein